jgi:hypothetical protein
MHTNCQIERAFVLRFGYADNRASANQIREIGIPAPAVRFSIRVLAPTEVKYDFPGPEFHRRPRTRHFCCGTLTDYSNNLVRFTPHVNPASPVLLFIEPLKCPRIYRQRVD